jgi:hypothetical protein
VRTFLRDLDAEEDGTRVLVVAHDALVLIFRYICERLTEPDILNIALADPVANASATRLVRPSGTGLWTLGEYNMSAHVAAYGAPVTVHPGDGAVLPQSAG